MVVTEQELNVGLYVFCAVELVGMLILGIRARRSGKAYLRRFPPVGGVPLDWYNPSRRWPRKGRPDPVGEAYRTRQADPELEAMRQRGHKQARLMLLWMFGFPIIVWGMFFLLAAVGYIH